MNTDAAAELKRSLFLRLALDAATGGVIAMGKSWISIIQEI
ncbi:hypothetical protein LJR129_005078 [Acidovorax sp. LjRoot129]